MSGKVEPWMREAARAIQLELTVQRIIPGGVGHDGPFPAEWRDVDDHELVGIIAAHAPAPPPAAVGEVAEEMDRRADAEAQRCHDAGIEGESAVELLALAKCEVWRVAAQMLRSLPAAPPAAEAATKETP